MNKIKVALAAGVITVGLSGCVSSSGSTQATGTAVGATGGALAGAVIANNTGGTPLVGALIGGIAGGIIGNAIGAYLDEQERQAMDAAMRKAAEAKTGERVVVTVPKTSKTPSTSKSTTTSTKTSKDVTKIEVIPGDSYTNAAGQQCRPMEQVVEKDGKTIQGKSAMCNTGKGWTEAAV